ncbi:MAG: sortase [Patescibacteria group bacterium]|jgi:LPXTG-site transpeptidase (sortase) family protein
MDFTGVTISPASAAPISPAPLLPDSARPSAWRIVIVALLSGIAVYFTITGPTYFKRAQYAAENFGKPNEARQYVDLNAPAESLSGAIGAALTQPASIGAVATPTVEQQVQKGKEVIETLSLENNLLVIPKIGVRAPIVWNSSSDEKIMLANLQQGVAHYGFTSLPNDSTGNVFITGHSSYYWWDKGDYKTVFALLDKLTAGDQAMLQYDGKVYVYTMRDNVTVSPSEVSVTDPTEQPTLSVMTCVPVGTSLRRLVVRFDLAKSYPAEYNGQVSEPAPADEAPRVEPPKTETPSTPTAPRNRDVIELIPAI